MASGERSKASLGFGNSSQRPQNKQSLPFHTPQMESIMKLKHKYQRNIQQTVSVIQNISFSKMPQKCLIHNNNYTLYCETDQKPMCASCLYQNQSHKNHRVLPLANCSSELKRDCDKLEKQLTSIVIDLTGLVKHLNQGISRLQKQFPHLVWKIEDCYKSLHQFLVDKEKQHVNQLRYYKQKMKYQHGALSTELNKIAMYVQQKIQTYQRKNQLDMLLTKRNVFDALKNTSKIVGQDLDIKQENQPKVHFEIFSQVEEFLYAKLPKLFSKQTKKTQNSTLHHIRNSRKRLNSNTKSKSQLSPLTKKQNSSSKSRLKTSLTPNAKQSHKISNKKNSTKQILSHKKTEQKSTRIPSKTPPKRERFQHRQSESRSNTSPLKQSQQKQMQKHSRSNSKSSSPKKK